MLLKTLTLVLYGVLFMGAASLAYGTFYDEGMAARVAGVIGFGDVAHDHHDEEHDDG